MEYDKITECHLPRSTVSATFMVWEPPNGLFYLLCITLSHTSSVTTMLWPQNNYFSGEPLFLPSRDEPASDEPSRGRDLNQHNTEAII